MLGGNHLALCLKFLPMQLSLRSVWPVALFVVGLLNLHKSWVAIPQKRWNQEIIMRPDVFVAMFFRKILCKSIKLMLFLILNYVNIEPHNLYACCGVHFLKILLILKKHTPSAGCLCSWCQLAIEVQTFSEIR